MRPTVAFLDVDEVLAGFSRAACERHGRDPATATTWTFWHQWPMSDEDFWGSFDEEFWANLPLTPEAEEIERCVRFNFGEENVCLLTSPSTGPTSACAAGKCRWIAKHFPRYSRRFLIGPPKHFCAHPGAVLIDDSDHNCYKFREAGGKTVLVPRPWNRLSALADMAATSVSIDVYLLGRHAPTATQAA